MATKRIVLGTRANGDEGLFVAPVGIDADTAGDSQLRMSIVSKISQLLMIGRVSAGVSDIPLGLSRSPYVFLTSQYDFSGISGHTLGPGPFRPSPPPARDFSSVLIISNGNSLRITSTYTCIYQVYSQAFT